MPKDWTAQISHVNFRCGECRKAFEGAPDLVEDDAEQAHHPYRYFAHCPHCGARHQPQASWERALLKAHQHSTGPKTPEGVAAVTANLEGHPTPHETLRTRFNAMKHGATARTATYFPAKAGGYAFCARCDVDRDWCSKQPACVKQTETFMLHHAAFEQRDPRVADGQSNASAWGQWAFAPMRFEGMTKHIMASALREVCCAGAQRWRAAEVLRGVQAGEATPLG